MNLLQQSKIGWSCRRGMKELDLLFMPFFEQAFSQLSAEQKISFSTLLEFDDLTLFDCFFKHKLLGEERLNDLIMLIKQFQICGKLS